MDVIFVLLFLISPAMLLVGMIRPKFIEKLVKRTMTRKQIATMFLSLFFISIIGIVATADTDEKTEETSTETVQKITVQETATPTATAEPEIQKEPSPKTETFSVSRVIDGDTVVLSNGQRVRYIGIDTPELNQNECYAKEATNKNKQLVEGKEVRLEKDVSETDRYGRLLRYVYTKDGQFVNDILVKEGYANASTYPPDVKHQSTFTESQRTARNSNLGLWGGCSTQTPAPTMSSTPQPATSGGACLYDCNGPDKDCADFSSHSQAQTFFECCGFTAEYDPMRLDSAKGVGNGLACESI